MALGALACLFTSASTAFVPSSYRTALVASCRQAAVSPLLRRAHVLACDAKVTEEMVVAAVEKAEALWADALAARERANALSVEAEAGSDDSVVLSESMAGQLEESSKFSLSMLGDARAVSSLS